MVGSKNNVWVAKDWLSAQEIKGRKIVAIIYFVRKWQKSTKVDTRDFQWFWWICAIWKWNNQQFKKKTQNFRHQTLGHRFTLLRWTEEMDFDRWKRNPALAIPHAENTLRDHVKTFLNNRISQYPKSQLESRIMSIRTCNQLWIKSSSTITASGN